MHKSPKILFVLHWCFSLYKHETKNILKEVLSNIKGNYMLPLYRAIVYWWSQSCCFSLRMLKTAITVPILLLVLLPSAAKRRWSWLPAACTASLIVTMDSSCLNISLMTHLTPSPFLA